MRTHYPFTNAGVQDLLNNLYLLPNDELQAEAGALLVDLKDWVGLHFTLSTAQVSYLDKLDDRTVRFIASNTSFAIENRLPVYLEKAGDDDGDEDEDPDYKVIEPNSTVTVASGSDGSFAASGEVTVKIYYKK